MDAKSPVQDMQYQLFRFGYVLFSGHSETRFLVSDIRTGNCGQVCFVNKVTRDQLCSFRFYGLALPRNLFYIDPAGFDLLAFRDRVYVRRREKQREGK